MSRSVFTGGSILLALASVVGCASDNMASKMSRLTIGMEKSQVVVILGEPATAAAHDDVEVLTYRLCETKRDQKDDITNRYIVKLKAGKVETFGRPDDLKQ